VTIPELLEQRTQEFKDRTFIICDDTEYSFNDINENACRVAANLAARGLGKEDRIVLLMGNCIEFLYFFMGAGRIGAVIVPVNPTLKPDEIGYIANNADATAIVMIPEFAPMLPALREAMPLLKCVFVLGDAVEGTEPMSALLEPVESVPNIEATEHSEAALIYTSGTTGMPKGVILTHRNYIWNARMISHASDLTQDDRFLCVLPLFHVNAQVVTVLTPLLGGSTVVIMGKFNPLGILPMIEKHKITIMSGVPTIYSILTSIPKAAEYDISSMRFFVSGAAPMPEETYQATQRVFKKPLIMGYGLSEATCASAVADFQDPVRWNSVGPPLRYTLIRIVDRQGRDVPMGKVGEILVAGATVMKGYYKNPEATQEVLKGGWLYTGDLGRFDEEGYLYIVGRLKDMIIRGGQNIYPAQVENVLLKLAGVEEVCVVGVEEPRWGQEVLAIVKLAEGQSLTERDVVDFCRDNLANYKCPRYVRFVNELPKTATGKVRKNVVAARFADIAKR